MNAIDRLLAGLVALALVGCSVTSSAAPSSSAGPSDQPVSRPSNAGSSVPATTPGRPVTPSAVLDAALGELMAAIGNPDTNAPSEASAAFDAALEAGEHADIAAAAATVLDHLAKARDLLDSVADWGDRASAAYELDRLLLGVIDGTTAVRDGGLEDDADAVEAGRTLVQEALLDHFWQMVYGPSSDRFTETLPDGRVVRPSRARLSMPASEAFDGNEDSSWVAGDEPPPQWVEVELGFDAVVTGVRLLTAQETPGSTTHVVSVRDTGGAERELTTLRGVTRDRQWLEAVASAPMADVRVVRVTTIETTSMVAWREIEVLLAEGSRPAPCAAGATNLALDAAVVAPLELPGHTGSNAVDGDPATIWDAGQPGHAVLIVDLGGAAEVSEVRFLTARAIAADERFDVEGSGPAGRRVLGFVRGPQPDRAWLSVPGPAPCVSLERVVLQLQAPASSASLREIEVLGRAAP